MANDINAEAREWVDGFDNEYSKALIGQDLIAAYLAGHASGSANGSVTNVTNIVLPSVTEVEGAGSVFRMTAGEVEIDDGEEAPKDFYGMVLDAINYRARHAAARAAHSHSAGNGKTSPEKAPPEDDSPVSAPCDTGEAVAASDGQIRWGEEIEVNGVRPEWLRGRVLCDLKTSCGWRNEGGELAAAPAEDWAWSQRDGEPCILAIRLPSDHFAYTALAAGFELWGGGDEAPKDWDGDLHGVIVRCGATIGNYASYWQHTGGEYDIIGYRKRAEASPRNIGITASDLECETLRREYDAVKVKLDAIIEVLTDCH